MVKECDRSGATHSGPDEKAGAVQAGKNSENAPNS